MLNQSEIDYLELRRQLTLAHSNLEELRNLLEKVGVRDFPSESPSALLNLLWKITEYYEAELVNYSERIDKSAPKNILPYSMLIRGISMGSLKLMWVAQYIEAASVENVPWGIYDQIKRICTQFDPTLNLIVRPSWDYSYSSTEANSELSKYTSRETEITQMLENQPTFLILSFPISERNNTLRHSVWGHEIGHILQDHLASELNAQSATERKRKVALDPLTDSFSSHFISKYIDRQQMDNLIKESLLKGWGIKEDAKLNPLNQSYYYEEMRLSFVRRITLMLNSWVTELISDILSIHIVGPAALFALGEVVHPIRALTKSSDTHPPTCLRINTIIRELRSLGYLDHEAKGEKSNPWGKFGPIVNNEIQYLNNLCQNAYKNDNDGKIARSSEDLQFEIVNTILNSEKLEELRAFVSGFVRNKDLNPEMLMQEVPSLVALLKEGIPPNKPELKMGEEPSSLAAILNAGWLVWLEFEQQHLRLGNQLNFRGISEERKKINKLVLKGIEASEIQRQYLERQTVRIILNAYVQPSPIIDQEKESGNVDER